MSRWLANVNSLLEKLDGTVEEAIDEQRDNDQDGEDFDSILAKRGLSEADKVQFVEESDEGDNVESEETQEEEQSEDHSSVVVVEGEESEGSNSTDAVIVENVQPFDKETNLTADATEKSVEASETEGKTHRNDLNDDFVTGSVEPDGQQLSGPSEDVALSQDTQPVDKTKNTEKLNSNKLIPRTPQLHITSLSSAPSSIISEPEFKQAIMDSREAQKETRTLRRHVVSLNKQLETAEKELDAQRFELQQAGDRLEKDRKKYKEEKEKLIAKQLEEVKALKKQHDQVLADVKTLHQDEIQRIQLQLKSAEEQRMQEGGNMTVELQNTLQREQELLRRMAIMEDEKITFLDQISTLQEQQDLVQSRLDSISHTADNAMMREREAEEKLDMTLTMHARQIAQRQSREAELERTIAELSSSLATSSSLSNEGDSAAGAGNVNALKAQIYSLEEDVETYKTRLEAERQRIAIMQQELRDMSKERTLEVSAHRSKQLQFDRQVADLSLQISKLQASLREAQRGAVASLEKSSSGVDPATHVLELTHELVRNQEKMGQMGSELSTLRNRLQVATARAEKAESALARFGTIDVEGGPESGNYQGGGAGMRRRKKDVTSIRAAINLQDSRNENIERVGRVIDGLDSFSVETGKYLRHNPLARGGFILYLVVLHLWTFAVLFLHTHRFETVHGDFGAGQQFAHGPHALMQHHDPETLSKIINEKAQAAQVAQQAVASPLEPPKDEGAVHGIKENAATARVE